MSDETTVVTPDPEQEAIEREAKEMGWDPEHKGEKFIPAKEFVERGRSILPIVQSTNKRLREELAATNAREQANAAELKALRAGQEALEEAREADLAAARNEARAEAKAELARASEAGDHVAIADATAKLTDLSIEDREAKAAAAAKKNDAREDDTIVRAPVQITPGVKAWMKANPEFARDPEKIALGNVIAMKMRQAGDSRTDDAFLDEVADRVEKRLNGHGTPSKVEGGGPRGGGGGGGGGKGYNDLPAEAKAACDRQVNKLVGPGRAHKDVASWQKAYAAKYFAQG